MSAFKYSPSPNAAVTGWSAPWKWRSWTTAVTFARKAPVASARVSAAKSTAAEHEQTTSNPPGRVARHAASASFA